MTQLGVSTQRRKLFDPGAPVGTRESAPSTQDRWARAGVALGAALFISALAISAAVVPELRLLHVCQALIYVAVVVFARSNSAWAFGAGVTVAVAWNSLELFVTHNMQRGIVLFWSMLRGGHARGIDTMAVALGGIGHFILIASCLILFFRGGTDGRKWARFAGGGVLVLAYFSAIVATFLKR